MLTINVCLKCDIPIEQNGTHENVCHRSFVHIDSPVWFICWTIMPEDTQWDQYEIKIIFIWCFVHTDTLSTFVIYMLFVFSRTGRNYRLKLLSLIIRLLLHSLTNWQSTASSRKGSWPQMTMEWGIWSCLGVFEPSKFGLTYGDINRLTTASKTYPNPDYIFVLTWTVHSNLADIWESEMAYYFVSLEAYCSPGGRRQLVLKMVLIK